MNQDITTQDIKNQIDNALEEGNISYPQAKRVNKLVDVLVRQILQHEGTINKLKEPEKKDKK